MKLARTLAGELGRRMGTSVLHTWAPEDIPVVEAVWVSFPRAEGLDGRVVQRWLEREVCFCAETREGPGLPAPSLG